MALTLNKAYAGIRAAVHNGKLVFIVRDGECNASLPLHKPTVALRASTHNGKLVYLVGDQKVNLDGTLILNKPYIGLLAKTHAGKKLYLVRTKPCPDPDDPDVDMIACGEGDFCTEVPAELTLSVNSIQLSTILGSPYTDDMARFIGDFTITYIADELIQRDVDEFCADTNLATSSLWFSEWIDATDQSPPQYWRYAYEACTGALYLHYKALDGQGCYLDEYYVLNPDAVVETLTLDDCDPYTATLTATLFTGSVSA